MPDPVDPKLLEITDKPVPVPVFTKGPKPSRFDLIRLFVSLMNELKKKGTIEGGAVDVKPGWQTSEFWITLCTTVISLGISMGYVPKDFPQTQITTMIAQAGGLIAAILFVWQYIHGRAKVKVAAIANSTPVPKADIQITEKKA
jgi:hypothetical protein